MNMITTVRPEAEDRDRSRTPRLPGWQKGAVLLIALAAIGWLLTHFLAAPQVTATPAPPTVTVATPLVRNVREWDDYVGRFAPSRTVEIRPRVSGEVTAVHFRDGEIVKQGQLLFTIDPRPFAAALAEARANAASARSTLALATSDLARAQRLTGDEALSGAELDALRAKVQAAQAALAAADARVRARALDVGFTQVRAPIAGRISDRRVDAGNQVAGGEGTTGTVLTTINALDPIYFTFDSSEALFLKMQRARSTSSGAVPVDIRLQDENTYSRQGHLDFTDNGLDPHSGTIRGRAVLPNPDFFLAPGMFGNMRLASGGPVKGLLVPDGAVQTDQTRKILLVVDGNGVVAAKPVELGPLVDGLRIVRSGLAAGDRVVIAGTQMALPGMKVTAQPGRIAPDVVASASGTTAPVSAAATFATN